MNPRKTLLFPLLLFCAATVAAQSPSVRFRVADRVTREAVVGAVAELRSRTDTAATPFYTTSDIEGRGTFPRIPRGDYRLTITSLGYDSLRTDLRVGTAALLLDSLWLTPRAEAIDQVTVEAPALRSSVRGDTLSYRASAYKVSFGSDAESLISKMPGLEVADGGIEAQGRTVRRVYVDGREFFGNDVMSAIRNIPADMIESIDIYNSQSDQSEFTGVDTGEGHTSLNIVTLPDKRRGAFGRLYGAYGIPDKYIGGGNVNIFDNDRRISVVGLVNNINRQNFSFEDILGTTDQSGKSSGNNFMVRPLDGISTVQAVGVNYSDDWGAKGKVTASYFFNRTDNHNTSLSDRQTFTSTDKLVLYNDRNDSKTLNLNHRFNSRIDYKFSDRHSMMMRTSFSLQDNNYRNELLSRTDNRFSDDDIRFVNRRRNFGHNNSDGYNVSNYLLYRYRLPGKMSHNLTVGIGGTYRSYDQLSRPRQYTFRDPDNIECDTTDYSSRNISRTDRDQPGYDVNGNVSYTRSLSKRSRLSLEYRINYTDNSVGRNTFIFDNKTEAFRPERDPKQSTEYDYAYLTHRVGSTYQYYFKKTKVAATLYYQHAGFSSDYVFPYGRKTETSFDNLTYSVVANININRNNTLKFNASGRTSNPRATDLQDIVNTTNRQNIFAGNPGLDPVYTHRLSGQYIRANPAKGRTFTVSAEATLSPNTITDSLVIDSPDFVIDDEGTLLGEGNQYTKPVNLRGLWSLRASVNYGMPVPWLRSNLNFRAGVSTGRIPSIINGERNELNNNVYNAGLTLGSNISESVDFRLSYTGRYNVSKSSSQVRTLDNTYFSQTAKAETTFVIWKRLVVRANADYNYYKGITDTFLEERLICNAMLGVKLFRNGLGEASVGVNDILDQNGTTFRRTVTGTTLRNVTNLGIGRYVSFQLTYNLRFFRRQRNAVLDALKGK